jgi:HlyD family secretion protein
MKRLITLLIIVIVAVGGYFAYRQYQARQQAAAESSLATATAGKGDLTATVGATGVVRSNQSTVLYWKISGTVDQVNVAVGDAVSKDAVLAALARTSLPQNVILAQADLVSAQKTLNDLYETSLSLAQAEQGVADAQKAVEDAQQRVDNLHTDARQTDIDTAQSRVVLAKDKLDKAKKAFQPYENKSENNVIRASLQAQLADAQQKYDNAVSYLNNLLGTASDTTMAVAESNLVVAKAQLEDAQKKYDELKAGPDPSDVTNAKTRIDAAQATIALADIEAPFGGKITEVDVKSGDQVNAGTMAFRLDDLSHLLVDVNVSEVDINRIQVGQDVTMTFDAILDKEYHGKVTQVALVGTSNQGVVDFTVTVELMDPDQEVRPGMTAAVNIVVNQLHNVLLVPNRAVRLQDSNRVVYVLRNGTPVPVKITLGASSDTMSQVVGGDLKVGDEIVLNPPTTFNQGGSPGFFRR